MFWLREIGINGFDLFLFLSINGFMLKYLHFLNLFQYGFVDVASVQILILLVLVFVILLVIVIIFGITTANFFSFTETRQINVDVLQHLSSFLNSLMH